MSKEIRNLRIKIIKTILAQAKSGNPQKEYILKVSYNLQIWNVNKNYSQIKAFVITINNKESLSYDMNEEDISQFFNVLCEIKDIISFQPFREFFQFDNFYVDNKALMTLDCNDKILNSSCDEELDNSLEGSNLIHKPQEVNAMDISWKSGNIQKQEQRKDNKNNLNRVLKKHFSKNIRSGILNKKYVCSNITSLPSSVQVSGISKHS